jgi:asparagine synthase (glutamine-hydrolysing)
LRSIRAIAGFVVTVDPDPARRERFIRAAAERIAPVDGLVAGRLDCDDLAVAWAAGPRAPVDIARDAHGAAVLWGRAHRDGRPIGAAELRTALAPQAPPLAGYHVAVRYEPGGGLLVGADLLGSLPVYVWARAGAVVVASTPQALLVHPGFRAVLDERGLAGVLLTTHLVDGRTLLRDVRRLPAATLLSAAGGRLREHAQWAPRAERPVDRYATDEEVEAHDGLLADAVVRHVAHVPAGEPVGLMLTGGRDSRLLAGYLLRAGREVRAATWGRRRDDDVALARRVARAAGIPHTIRPDVPGDLPGAVLRTARYEQGAIPNANAWSAGRWQAELPPSTVNGFTFGNALGGSSMDWAGDGTFEAFFARINAWGIGPARLRALLAGERFAGAVDHVVERIRAIHAGMAEDPRDRAWCFDLLHRQRFHVGALAVRAAFFTWPVSPVVDHLVLDATGRLPYTALRHRRMQDTLLRTRFPHLSTVPVDGNDNDPRPLLWPLRAKLEARARRAARRVTGVDRRRYPRVYDFNSAPWRAVRELAEPARPRGEAFFDPAALLRELPPPQADYAAPDAIIDSAGAKALLGALLWLDAVGPA